MGVSAYLFDDCPHADRPSRELTSRILKLEPLSLRTFCPLGLSKHFPARPTHRLLLERCHSIFTGTRSRTHVIQQRRKKRSVSHFFYYVTYILEALLKGYENNNKLSGLEVRGDENWGLHNIKQFSSVVYPKLQREQLFSRKDWFGNMLAWTTFFILLFRKII